MIVCILILIKRILISKLRGQVIGRTVFDGGGAEGAKEETPPGAVDSVIPSNAVTFSNVTLKSRSLEMWAWSH